MCGIFGAIDVEGYFSAQDVPRFIELTDLVSYRGPDSAGHKSLCLKSKSGLDGAACDVFLGHRRLSIIDLSEAGNQPMTDGRGRWLVFNGEIFNFLELKEELKQLGDVFDTNTDSEVILRIYSRYGIEGFAKLNGMWALALVDVARRVVILSRDRFSIKPLYYLQQGSRFYFGSEIKQLLPLLDSKTLNRAAMTAFLSQLLLDHTEETFFQRVKRIPAKTSVVIPLDGGHISFHRYWDYGWETRTDLEQSVEMFRELLEDSVRIRLRSDVRVGCLLSGGLDSSAIAMICHGLGADNVETFSVVSDDSRYSEESFIDTVSERTGVKNTKLVFEYPNVVDVLDAVLQHSDEPVATFSAVAQYQMFQLIKQETNVTVLLSGQGGDETLLGYSKFFFFYVQSLIKRRLPFEACAQILASLVHGTAIRQFHLSNARRYIPWLNSKPYGGALREDTNYKPAATWSAPDLRQRQIDDIDLYSVPALTHYEDRNSMAHSLEVRHPFLDHRLVNFSVNLPSEYKIRDGWSKFVLRRAFPELPDTIRWRKDKQGFTVPEKKWIKGDLQPLVRDLFARSRLGELGIIDDKKFIRHYEQFVRGDAGMFLDICRALIAEVWVRRVLDRDETVRLSYESTPLAMVN